MKTSASVGAALFFVAAPGVVAGLVPYVLTGWRLQPPWLGLVGMRSAGILLLAAGLLALIECFVRFVRHGGTPAPVAPTERLVVSGLYRYVRNPMYVAVVSIILGQALLFGSRYLLGYAGIVWLLFHSFVVIYEEPTLRRRYGADYGRYASQVNRWWPRWRAWEA